MICPITKKRRKNWDTLHKGIKQHLKGMRCRRGPYDEITRWYTSDTTVIAPLVLELFRPALEKEYCEFDRKRRGDALSHDLYAYDPDQGVAIIQARQFSRRRSHYFARVRKTYFLTGRNEITHEAFRHPVSAQVVRRAVRDFGDDQHAIIRAIQSWMWKIPVHRLETASRQGDVLLVPVRRGRGQLVGTTLTLAESHVITAKEIRLDHGRCFALDPTVIHVKGQHAPEAILGWTDIRVAREAKAWNFAERIGD